MKNGDFLDLFTPLIVIPLYWALFKLVGRSSVGLKSSLVFIVFVAFWILGQGMHLAANSIGHLLDNMKGTDAYKLTEFYDETLSHYLWHFGILGLSGTLIYHQWKNPFYQGNSLVWALIVGGIIYGFAYFTLVVEGVTWPMGLPFAVLATAFILIFGRKNLGQNPLLLFFLVGYLAAILFFTIWGIWQGGFPEFSSVGFIK